MGKRYLIDTNVLIEYLANALPSAAHAFIADVVDDNFNISFINKIEILGHPSANKQIEEFLNHANVFTVTEELINKTIEIRLNNRTKLPDALIAATAIVNQFILLTRNTDDFKNIDNLEVKDPRNV